MIPFDLTAGRPSRLRIGGAPEGHDARVLLALAKRAGKHGLLHVALDDTHAARLAELIAFFAPDLEILHFPAWDCLPYDRTSPNAGVVSQRVATLVRLLEPHSGRPRLILTTVNALIQKVPPRAALGEASFRAKLRERIDLVALQTYLAHNGYTRAQTVREPGDFAVRGGIVDLFPPEADNPLRLDLFGDELESVRVFDPISQRTIDKRDAIILRPAAEYSLDPASIARFRAGYREQFGAVLDADPLYEAVSAGRKHAGMEHWLPLFYDDLDTLFEYLPQAIVSFDHQVEEAKEARLAQIADFYQARLATQGADKRANNPLYKPIPPRLLYLDEAGWTHFLGRHALGLLSPFTAPPGIQGTVDAGGRPGHDFVEARNRPDVNVFDAVHSHIDKLRADGRRVLIAGYTQGSRDRLVSVLTDHGIQGIQPVETWEEAQRFRKEAILGAVVLGLEHGFESGDLALIAEQDILGDRLARPAKKRRRAANFLSEAAGLTAGDLVVHVDHGIGRYEGLETLAVSGAPHDCLRLIYAGGDKLYLPVENIDMLSRYGSEDAGVQLDKLGGAGWQGRKARVKRRLKDMAEALLRIAAERALRRAEPIAPADGLYAEFCARFPYPETDDQLKAIEDVLEDLSAGRAMDRLVCGDVGFGKTEVALRAAFVAAMSGQQVAVVVPTTLLARQHYRSFANRFAGLPVQIEQLSRMVGAKDTARIKKALADGNLDIVVGTHALLSKTIQFKRLGLVIIDEEQHFGVKQKERLKELRHEVHVLTLTATPIPRTLQMALSGVRELSLIATPPVDRLAVRTFVLPFDPVVIREAILREHFRGGQSFYVVPRIEDLAKVQERLHELVPEVKLVSAHGQMGATELEQVMSAFDDGAYDVLLSTNIIESGLDIPRANTLVIHRADLFGLAQLYQLRGRVGRSKLRGYAYLTYSSRAPLSTTAQQRLNVIQTLDTLGAGFQLASHDMDIRGAGNLLGEEQSGQIREVGIELFQQMLEEAVNQARAGGVGSAASQEEERKWTPQINLGMPVLIPDTYVPDLGERLTLYRRLGQFDSMAEIDAFAAELVDRFGTLPEEVSTLLEVMAIKQLCRKAGVERLDAGPKGAVITFHDNSFARPEKLVDFIQKQAGTIKVRPDQKLVQGRTWESDQARLKGVHKLIKQLAAMATADPIPPPAAPARPQQRRPPVPPAPAAAKSSRAPPPRRR